MPTTATSYCTQKKRYLLYKPCTVLQAWVSPCREADKDFTVRFPSLGKSMTNPKKGERDVYVSSLSQIPSSPREVRREQNSLVNGYPKKHCEKKPSPSAFQSMYSKQGFSTFLPPWHIQQMQFTCNQIKTGFMYGILTTGPLFLFHSKWP